MSEYKQQDALWQISGKINGEITMGHIDVLLRYLKECVSCDAEEAQHKLNRLRKVDPRIWGKAIAHPDFEGVLDTIMTQAALGICNFTKEQREWFKMLRARCGLSENQSKPGHRPSHVEIKIEKLDVQPGSSHWIDPKEGTLPDSMKKGIRGLDPEIQ